MMFWADILVMQITVNFFTFSPELFKNHLSFILFLFITITRYYHVHARRHVRGYRCGGERVPSRRSSCCDVPVHTHGDHATRTNVLLCWRIVSSGHCHLPVSLLSLLFPVCMSLTPSWVLIITLLNCKQPFFRISMYLLPGYSTASRSNTCKLLELKQTV